MNDEPKGKGRGLLILMARHRWLQSFFCVFFLLWTGVTGIGCSVKRTVKVKVPPRILHAKSATFEEVLAIINNYSKINKLSCGSLKITLISGKKESGELQKYASAPGYILLQRPNHTRLVVQYPITKTTILDLVSAGDDFCVWVPRENKYYTGKNSAGELVAEDLPNAPGFTLRATHIFEAILPQIDLDDDSNLLFEYSEQVDSEAKYYIFSVFKKGFGNRLQAVKKFWIERSQLTIARQQVYGEDGQLVSDIFYSNNTPVNGFDLPLRIHIDRPIDGYRLEIEFASWRINPDFPENAFTLPPPTGAQIVPLKEKGRRSFS